MVLLTAENEAILKKLVSEVATEAELKLVERFLQQEESIISSALQELVNNGIEGTGRATTDFLDGLVKDLVQAELKVGHEQEAVEKEDEQKSAENLLDDYSSKS